MTYYIVFVYSDYRKEFGVQILRVFTNKDEAIQFAKMYTSKKLGEPEYTWQQGNEYDQPFLGNLTDEDPDEEEEYKKYQIAKEQLKIHPNMWYMRIAVSSIES